MIKELTGLPAGVIGFETGGQLTAADCRDVVIPALDRAAASGVARFLIVVPEFREMPGGAVWQDLRAASGRLRAWRRIALVTDVGWLAQLGTLFGTMAPAQLRRFPLAQQDRAVGWLAR